MRSWVGWCITRFCPLQKKFTRQEELLIGLFRTNMDEALEFFEWSYLSYALHFSILFEQMPFGKYRFFSPSRETR
jgi:hypothetical protein